MWRLRPVAVATQYCHQTARKRREGRWSHSRVSQAKTQNYLREETDHWKGSWTFFWEHLLVTIWQAHQSAIVLQQQHCVFAAAGSAVHPRAADDVAGKRCSAQAIRTHRLPWNPAHGPLRLSQKGSTAQQPWTGRLPQRSHRRKNVRAHCNTEATMLRRSAKMYSVLSKLFAQFEFHLSDQKETSVLLAQNHNVTRVVRGLLWTRFAWTQLWYIECLWLHCSLITRLNSGQRRRSSLRVRQWRARTQLQSTCWRRSTTRLGPRWTDSSSSPRPQSRQVRAVEWGHVQVSTGPSWKLVLSSSLPFLEQSKTTSYHQALDWIIESVIGIIRHWRSSNRKSWFLYLLCGTECWLYWSVCHLQHRLHPSLVPWRATHLLPVPTTQPCSAWPRHTIWRWQVWPIKTTHTNWLRSWCTWATKIPVTSSRTAEHRLITGSGSRTSGCARRILGWRRRRWQKCCAPTLTCSSTSACKCVWTPGRLHVHCTQYLWQPDNFTDWRNSFLQVSHFALVQRNKWFKVWQLQRAFSAHRWHCYPKAQQLLCVYQPR